MKVNGLEYTLSERRDSNNLIIISYSFGIGNSYEVYFAVNCEYEYTMKEIRKCIKSSSYAIAYYCDHKEYGDLYNCICF